MLDAINEFFAQNPEAEQDIFISYENDEMSAGMILSVANFGNAYALAVPQGDMPVVVYATSDFDLGGGISGVEGWQNLDSNNSYTFEQGLIVSEISTTGESLNGVVFGK